VQKLKSVVVDKDPKSALSLRRVKDWLRTCDEKHDKCQKSVNSLPTRVLDVSGLGKIKLVETCGSGGRYIALSHCWGSSKPELLTTTITLENMKEGFELSQAPKTFRDAILVTRSLGVPYLWIDSLCIIQGDDADWAAESSKMGDVYSGAYLTIAASNAADDHAGFLHDRPYLYAPLRIEVSPGKSVNLFLQRGDGYNQKLFYFIRPEPLRARAWTLQEWYLSPRILDFGSSMMIFECRNGVIEEFTVDGGSGRSRHDVEKIVPCLENGGPGHRNWADVIEEYSGRALTFERDKLPALSGVASRVAARTKSTYCAGLWWEDMPFGLLWRRSTGTRLQKPTEWLAPSWSWASSIGPVVYSFTNSHVDYSRLEPVIFESAIVEADERDQYGRVRSGRLCIRAILIPLAPSQGSMFEAFRQIEERRELESEFSGFLNGRGSFDYPQEFSRFKDKYWSDETDEDEYAGHPAFEFNPVAQEAQQTVEKTTVNTSYREVSALLLTCIKSGRGNFSRGLKIEGILVVEGISPSTYERVGYFRATDLSESNMSKLLKKTPQKLILC
jgi:hypothetical protein